MTAPTPHTASVFGSRLRSEWLIDPAVTYLNHGTVGAPPRRVIERQREIADEIERHPARFMLRELTEFGSDGSRPPRLREAADAVAPFLGIPAGDDLLFVENITTGANAVLRSFPLAPGDEVVVTSLGYGGVTNAARFACRAAGAELRTIDLPRPGAAPGDFVEAVAAGLSDRTRLAVVDHITAATALVLPIADIAAACHARGVAVLADGAHVPGNIPVDVDALGVDFYAANLHKWAWTPRSCGVLWAAPRHRSMLHPTVISWGLDQGLTTEFDLLGTRDPTPFLTAPFAIELLREHGLDEVHRYNHDLAWWTGHHLAERWGTTFDTPEEMIGAMVCVRLPDRLGTGDETAARVQAALRAADVEVPVHAGPTSLETRVSCQIYCDEADVDRLADLVLTLARP